MDLWSRRFNKAIRLIYHAKARMEERDITQDILLDLIENGNIKFKDDKHYWIFKNYPDRKDNLVCAAMIMNEVIIIKTVMINWQLEE